MAKFKIYLMSLRNSNQGFSPRYSLMPISEFDSNYKQDDILQQLASNEIDWATYKQKRGQQYENSSWTYSVNNTAVMIQDTSFNYTTDEKFTIHQNSQRTLSFKMYRKVIRADRIETNPFINYLFIGAQLLLIDKYDNHHLMTVSKISYQFNELNTEFSYECQDSFNYQLSRQNNGYEITNDMDDTDFIGAQSLDWWVLCKIHPDCKISYQYLKLSDSATFKEAYGKSQYNELYRTVPFSASGTANSVLIALGELYDLQLKVYERVDLRKKVIENGQEKDNDNYGSLVKYYWFEPKKSSKPTGLKYSPYLDLQNFSLDHLGNSFSSVLNVQSTQIGDEIITLIPPVPNFFRQWFDTEDWRTSIFTPGLFMSACQEYVDYVQYNNAVAENIDNDTSVSNKSSFYNANKILYNPNSGNVYIPIKPNQWKQQYDFLRFSTNVLHSKLLISTTDGSKSYNSRLNTWKIVYKISSIDQEQESWSNSFNVPYNQIASDELQYCFIELYVGKSSNAIIFGDLYISQYRIPTTDELKFAAIADQLPWLENKLIDFNYFYNHSIINSMEHNSIMNTLENDLRKANAKLLIYSQNYYESMQQKTKLLAKLSEKLDLVGATFQHDVIQTYAEQGKAIKTSDFSLAITNLFANSSQPIHILEYYETLGDYVNKYFNAEQTFLKNTHLFKEYFEARANLGVLYQYSFILDDSTNTQSISFTSLNQYAQLNDSNKHLPIYIKQEQSYTPYNTSHIVNENNYSNFYKLNKNDGVVEITDDTEEYHTFSDKTRYFERVWKAEVKTEDWPKDQNDSLLYVILGKIDNKLFEANLLNVKHSTDKCEILLSCYMHCLHTTNLSDNKTFITDDYGDISITITSVDYKPVNYTEMRTNFFYQQLNNSDRESLKYMHRRKKDILQPVVSLNDSGDYTKYWPDYFNNLGLSTQTLLCIPNSKNWTSERIMLLENEDQIEADDVYKESFPITSLYWFGQSINEDNTVNPKSAYHEVPFVNIENCVQFHRRVSVASEARRNWNTANNFVLPLLIYWIAELVWNNGVKDFSNEGYTYHDIFNCNYSPAFGDGWTKSTRLMYVTNSAGYEKTQQKAIFDEECFGDGEKWHGQIKNEEDEIVQGPEYQSEEDEDNDIAQVVNWGYHEAVNIPLTYHSFSRRLNNEKKSKYHYKTKYWRLLKKTDIINNIDSVCVVVSPDHLKYLDLTKTMTVPTYLQLQNEEESLVETLYRLDSTVYYPLKNVLINQSLSGFKWPTNTTNTTLEALLNNNNGSHSLVGEWETNGDWKDYIWNGSINQSKGSLIFMCEEDFYYEDLTSVSWDSVGYEKIWEYSSSTYYDNRTFEPINLTTKYPKLTVGFFVIGHSDEDYSIATSFNDNDLYYEKINNKYEERHTLNQLIRHNDTYVKLQNVYDYASFSPVTEINVPYFIYTQDSSINVTIVKEEVGVINKNNNNQWCITGPSIGTVLLKEVIYKTTDLNNCTNGWFWYTYKNHNSTILMEKAMLIETNLTEYWTNAYYASKNCKFFLPEYWQPTVDHKINYFSSEVLSYSKSDIKTENILFKTSWETHADFTSITTEVTEEGKYKTTVQLADGYTFVSLQFNAKLGELTETTYENTIITDSHPLRLLVTYKTGTFVTTNVSISSMYIPQSTKVPYQPFYQFKHYNIFDSLPTTRASQHNLNIGDSISLSSISDKAITQMINYLNIDANNWIATKLSYGDNTLYEYVSGGMLWSDVLMKLTNEAVRYDNFGGWYDMMIRVLQSCNYENYDPVQYKQAKEEHDNIWRQIYTKYPNLIYEQSYSNSDATSAEQLLSMAQWSFKDYLQPESNYNIAVIDSNTLKGYKGQELKIGDGIEINADELYDDIESDIYKSLIQYLYITDISYDLRHDDNIQLTVNSIKYKDKVIGELVKLIR